MKDKKTHAQILRAQLRETGRSVCRVVLWEDLRFNYKMAFWRTLETIRRFKEGEISLRTCRRECAAIRNSLWLAMDAVFPM